MAAVPSLALTATGSSGFKPDGALATATAETAVPGPTGGPALNTAAPGMLDAHWRLEPFGHADLAQARQLLLACYADTPAALWDRGLQRLQEVPSAPKDQPLGVLLVGPAGPAGLALLLASHRPWRAGTQRHINGSSWGILPAARDRALWMARHGLAELTTTYSALTPIPSAVKLLERVGFEAVTHQQILAATLRLAGLPRRTHPAGATLLAGAEALRVLRDHPLAQALQDHRRLGCWVLALQPGRTMAEAPGFDGEPAEGFVPLVFRPVRRLGWLPAAELVYAPSQALVAAHAPLLALQLLRRGAVLMAFDAHQDLVPGFPCTRLFQRRYARCQRHLRGVDYLYSELIYLHR
jgi:hypothetical protein